jgi:hypothetical protein
VYFYCVGDNYQNTNRAYPALYSDLDGVPYRRLSKDESVMNFHTATSKWVSGSITTNGVISAGSYVWFGAFLRPSWNPAFDYGGKLFRENSYHLSTLPDYHPYYNYLDEGDFQDMRLTMYFQYGKEGENYVCTITQGVSLNDARAVKSVFNRVIFSGVNAVHSGLNGSLFFIRRIADKAAALFVFSRSVSLKYFIFDTVLS